MVETGISFGTIRSLLIFFAPILLPRVLTFFRYVRFAITRRPRPRPLPPKAARALNLLFFSVFLFLFLSTSFSPYAPSPSIFSLTRSRFNTSLEVIFNRLARHRPDGVLTEADELLRSKLTSADARKMYLRFGAEALTQCQFCIPENTATYVAYYLALYTFIPHLFHMAIVGLATSAPVAGRDAARWRNKFTMAGLALAAIDIYAVITFDPIKSGPRAVRDGRGIPSAVFEKMAVLRPLSFAVFDAVLAAFIYLAATNRFFFTPPSQADEVDRLVSASVAALSGASSKMHAASVTRNAVVRDKVLKDRDDEYWQTVVAMDAGGQKGEKGLSGIWEEEEVVRAMSRAMAGQGGVDLAKLGSSAAEYVNGVTAGLESGRSQERS